MNSSKSTSDHILWKLVSNDDKKAFEKLYSRYFESLIKHCSKYNLNELEAEEVVSDVFVNLWIKRKNLTILNFRKYLYSSTKNRVFDHTKSKQLSFLSLGQPEYDSLESYYNADIDINLRELKQHLGIIIKKLPLQHRNIFSLNKLSGYKTEEIAQILNISPKTVSNRLSEASKIISKELKTSLHSTSY